MTLATKLISEAISKDNVEGVRTTVHSLKEIFTMVEDDTQ